MDYWGGDMLILIYNLLFFHYVKALTLIHSS